MHAGLLCYVLMTVTMGPSSLQMTLSFHFTFWGN